MHAIMEMAESGFERFDFCHGSLDFLRPGVLEKLETRQENRYLKVAELIAISPSRSAFQRAGTFLYLPEGRYFFGLPRPRLAGSGDDASHALR